MIIQVVQGERDTVANCRGLARFELHGIPPMKAGLARIEVTYAIDANGQLTVSARETTTDIISQIQVSPAMVYPKSNKSSSCRRVLFMLLKIKLLACSSKLKLKPKGELLALQSALDEFTDLLSDEEQTNLRHHMQVTADSLNTDDKAAIDEAIKALKVHSDHFASVIMDKNVKDALTGTRTSDW